MTLQNFWKMKLRYEIREKLKTFDYFNIAERSLKISKKIVNIEKVKEAKTIYLDVPLFKDEVQTFDLINFFLHNWKSVIVTKIVRNESVLINLNREARIMQWKFDFIWNLYNGDIDVAIIPWLAFSLSWKRMWKWWWYYDRLLAKHKETYKIWACFEFQILEEDKIPMEDHDIKMDMIVTD